MIVRVGRRLGPPGGTAFRSSPGCATEGALVAQHAARQVNAQSTGEQFGPIDPAG
ncbi:MAG: hypothetical protein Q8L35_01355 [Actinomycetota bacterium]|nr:hypothetical protein [Actinomycetota bacterium]